MRASRAGAGRTTPRAVMSSTTFSSGESDVSGAAEGTEGTDGAEAEDLEEEFGIDARVGASQDG